VAEAWTHLTEVAVAAEAWTHLTVAAAEGVESILHRGEGAAAVGPTCVSSYDAAWPAACEPDSKLR
jgi:hypothetical protein